MCHSLNQKEYEGYRSYILENEKISLHILPQKGMMISKMDVYSTSLIETDLERLENHQTTGMPILYPTPNRVSGDGFIFEENKFKLMYKGEPILIHGAALRFEFKIVKEEIRNNYVAITGELVIEKGTLIYDYFPFESKLTLTIQLMDDAVNINYEVLNLSNKNLPFGLGFHPFLNKVGNVLFRIQAKKVYECDAQCYPSGQLLPLTTLPYDITNYTSVDSYAFDHVFTNIQDFTKTAEVIYEDLELKLTFSASEDFGHLVVYTPKGKAFFCIENQTCSTDCHNLYNKGFSSTGLQVVKPQEEKSGWIRLQVGQV